MISFLIEIYEYTSREKKIIPHSLSLDGSVTDGLYFLIFAGLHFLNSTGSCITYTVKKKKIDYNFLKADLEKILRVSRLCGIWEAGKQV